MGTILINRAPVLTLWAAVVAERLGYDEAAALSLAKAVAGLNAQAKGRALGLYDAGHGRGGEEPQKTGLGEDSWIQLLGRPVPVKQTAAGLRAVVKDQPVDPAKVGEYLARQFGEDLAVVRDAMAVVAASYSPEELAERAYACYEAFRPAIAAGRAGWGQKGELDLDRVRACARSG